MFAAGNYANMVPGKKPDWPAGNTIRQSIAIGTADDSTYWLPRKYSFFFIGTAWEIPYITKV
jgi:hypothetical protein